MNASWNCHRISVQLLCKEFIEAGNKGGTAEIQCLRPNGRRHFVFEMVLPNTRDSLIVFRLSTSRKDYD